MHAHHAASAALAVLVRITFFSVCNMGGRPIITTLPYASFSCCAGSVARCLTQALCTHQPVPTLASTQKKTCLQLLHHNKIPLKHQDSRHSNPCKQTKCLKPLMTQNNSSLKRDLQNVQVLLDQARSRHSYVAHVFNHKFPACIPQEMQP